MDDAAVIADHFDRLVSRDCLDDALRRQSEELSRRIDEKADEVRERVTQELTGKLTASWRRDLLLISVGQFFALAAAVAALVTLG
ncbi:MAG: hypothetical protein ACRDUY_11575 [Nitriliruptorales bacterium]